MSRLPSFVALALLSTLAASARADLQVPGASAPKLDHFVTHWPAVSPCAADGDFTVGMPRYQEATIRWWNAHGDELRLDRDHAHDTLPPALVRDPPTQLELNGAKRTVVLEVGCRGGSISWYCHDGRCERSVHFAIDATSRAHYAARGGLIERARMEPARTPQILIDEALWLLAETCAHRRCDHAVARKVATRLRTVRKMAWDVEDTGDPHRVVLQSTAKVDIINCVSYWCVINIGSAGSGRLAFTVYDTDKPRPTWEGLTGREGEIMIYDTDALVSGDLVR